MFFGCPALCYRGMRKAGDWPGLYSRALTQGQYHNRRVLYETAHDSVLSDSNMKPCWLYKGQRLWVGGDNLCRRGGGGAALFSDVCSASMGAWIQSQNPCKAPGMAVRSYNPSTGEARYIICEFQVGEKLSQTIRWMASEEWHLNLTSDLQIHIHLNTPHLWKCITYFLAW